MTKARSGCFCERRWVRASPVRVIVRKPIVLVLLFFAFATGAFAADCVIETASGERIEGADCRWERGRIYFVDGGKDRVLDAADIFKVIYRPVPGPDCSIYETLVNNYAGDGLLLEVRDDHHFYVTPAWYEMSPGEKETAARIFSEYGKCRDGSRWAVVHDASSGRELGKYINRTGYVSHE